MQLGFRSIGQGIKCPPCLGSSSFCVTILFLTVRETWFLLLVEIMNHPPEHDTFQLQPVEERLSPLPLQLLKSKDRILIGSGWVAFWGRGLWEGLWIGL